MPAGRNWDEEQVMFRKQALSVSQHSQGATRRTHVGRLRPVSFIAALTTLLSSAPSFADGGTVYFTNVVPEEITVNSNGSSYTGIAGSGLGNIAAEAHIDVDTQVSGRIKSWSVWLQLLRGEDSLSL